MSPPEVQEEPACSPAPTKVQALELETGEGWDMLTRWKLCVKKISNGRGNLESLVQVGTLPIN